MSSSPSPPPRPRAVAFVDGQNLIHDVERLFGYTVPNFDIVELCHAVCDPQGWDVAGIRFYTGVPTRAQNPHLKAFWDNKIFGMTHPAGRVEAFPRPLKDRDVSVKLYSGVAVEIPTPAAGAALTSWPVDGPWTTRGGRELGAGTVIRQSNWTEKGIDVSIAVDAIRFALAGRFDVCVFFSRDADLLPAVEEIKDIARQRGVTYRLASAFPSDGGGYGIPGTVWLKIPKPLYDTCIDPKDYFPKGRR